jgi:hypothetical protein
MLRAGNVLCETEVFGPLSYYNYGHLVANIMGVPLLAGGAILATAWIATGFKRGKSKNSN